MKLNHKRILSFFISILFTAISTFGQSRTSTPNIVLIMADDMGYGDLSVNGAIGYRTDNITKLASEGMRFTNFYAAQAVCSASRAALMTGCYPNRVGITGALSPLSKIGLSNTEQIIPQLLKSRGYATAIVGKWHLGHYPKFLPLQHGFDQYFGLPYSNDMWSLDYDGVAVTTGNKTKFPPLMLMDGNKPVKEVKTFADQDQLTTLYTEKAVSFISQHKNKPFFLYMAHSMPHVPLGVSSKFRGKSGAGSYGDVLMELDWSVGEIMKALDKNGLTGNTIVVFTSDNGPWLSFGNHGGSSGGFREGKGTTWEGGQRVPCIVKWPGKVRPGQVCEQMAANIDFLPTLVAASGAALPQNKIDGVNIMPLLLGEKNAAPRNEFYYYYRTNSLHAVRKGNWKLVLPHAYRTNEGAAVGKDGKPGAQPMANVTDVALYNLRSDPGERYDLKASYPEVLNELKQLAEQARRDLGDDLTNVKGVNVRKAGLEE